MNNPTLMGRGKKESHGLKHQVHVLLARAPGTAFNLSQISGELGLTKLDHPEISSSLAKLDREGVVQTTEGPAPHARGIRKVKHYQIKAVHP